MSDARLRELERQAATGDADAGARLLLERERLGHFTRERLALAAHAGDPTARQALDLPAQDGLDLLAWARGFYAFGQHACVRVVAAAILERFDARQKERSIALLRPWLRCPCDEHAAPIKQLSRPRATTSEGLVGALLGLEWDQGPVVTLQTYPELEQAERAREPFEALGASVDVDVAAAADGFTLRLRESFAVRSKIVLIKEVRAASGFGLVEALGAVDAVSAVPRAIAELAAARGDPPARELVGHAITAWALDPASR
mgnify:CR=1 FL=1